MPAAPGALLPLLLLGAACEGTAGRVLDHAPPPDLAEAAPPDLAPVGPWACGDVPARAEFDRSVLPQLGATCGGCHTQKGGIGPPFLASVSADPYDPYPTVAGWPGFLDVAPEKSLLLTKGVHEGPSLTPAQYAWVLCWLRLEQAGRAPVRFTDIVRDLDTVALGCTAPVGACHGGSMPIGVMRLKSGSMDDAALLRANYEEVRRRVDLASPAESPLLTKPLATRSDVQHAGGKTYFRSERDPIYQRWLLWIQLGAPF